MLYSPAFLVFAKVVLVHRNSGIIRQRHQFRRRTTVRTVGCKEVHKEVLFVVDLALQLIRQNDLLVVRIIKELLRSRVQAGDLLTAVQFACFSLTVQENECRINKTKTPPKAYNAVYLFFLRFMGPPPND